MLSTDCVSRRQLASCATDGVASPDSYVLTARPQRTHCKTPESCNISEVGMEGRSAHCGQAGDGTAVS